MLLKPENPQICIYTVDGVCYIPVNAWNDLKMNIDRLIEKSKSDPRKDEISGIQLRFPIKYEAGCIF